MKTLKIALFLFAGIILATSCKKNEETPLPEATAEEAAVIVSTSFCTGNAGTMTQIEDAVALSQSSAIKSTNTDSAFTISSAPGALITYQYQVEYSYGFVGATNYQLTYNSAGTYSSVSLSSNVTAAGSLEVTGFLSGNSYIVNGQSGRTGNFSMKIGNKNGITGTVNSTVTNFKFDKTSGVCTEGSAIVVLAGTTTAGRSFTFNGTLVYQGNKIATLTIGGKTFTINLTTGVVTP